MLQKKKKKFRFAKQITEMLLNANTTATKHDY